MSNKDKLMIPVPCPAYRTFYVSDFEGDPIDVARKFVEIETEQKKFLQSLKIPKAHRVIKYDPNWDLICKYKIDIDRYDDQIDIKILFYREETDKEYEDRMKKNRQISIASKKAAEEKKLREEQKEKELYKKLKEKYG